MTGQVNKSQAKKNDYRTTAVFYSGRTSRSSKGKLYHVFYGFIPEVGAYDSRNVFLVSDKSFKRLNVEAKKLYNLKYNNAYAFHNMSGGRYATPLLVRRWIHGYVKTTETNGVELMIEIANKSN